MTINLRDAYHVVVQSLLSIEEDLDGKGGAQNKANLDDARRLIKAIFCKDFALKLSGISDLYDLFGHLVNEVQTVDLLPYERYDNCMDLVMKFQVMEENMSHAQCMQNLTECAWPRLHKDLQTLENDGTFMGGKVERDYGDRLRSSRFFTQVRERENEETVGERVTRKMKQLAAQMKRDLREGMFNEEVTDGIEMIRSIVDMKGLAERVKAHGAVNVGHMDGQSFAENMKKLTNSVDNIPNEKLEDAFTKFLKSFEQYIEGKGIDKIDSKQVLRDYLNTESKLYVGNEIIIHCLLSVAVKYSVESSVESLISRYEVHFSPERQLEQENAHMEMYTAENGPILVQVLSYPILPILSYPCSG